MNDYLYWGIIILVVIIVIHIGRKLIKGFVTMALFILLVAIAVYLFHNGITWYN